MANLEKQEATSSSWHYYKAPYYYKEGIKFLATVAQALFVHLHSSPEKTSGMHLRRWVMLRLK